MKKILVLACVALFAIILSKVSTCSGNQDTQANETKIPQLDTARTFAAEHGMTTDTILQCDFKIHSGIYRFFVYSGDSIVLQALCAHGCGAGSTEDTPAFSNAPGSNASSLGFYRVGAFYTTVNYGLPSSDSTD